MDRIYVIVLIIILAAATLDGQSLFQVKDENSKIVLDVTKNGLIILNPAGTGVDDTLFVITSEQLKAFIKGDTGKGLARSFEVVSASSNKATQSPVMDISKENSFIGLESGAGTTTGLKNIFLGYCAGKNNTQGWRNIFIGDSSGFGINWSPSAQIGSDNVFIGTTAGKSNYTGEHNIFMGTQAGKTNRSGSQNILIGWRAGLNLYDGSYNTNIGYLSGAQNQHGSYNTFLGYYSGHWTTGNNNTFLGSDCGMNNAAGYSNTFIGKTTGWYNETGNRNVFLGMEAGKYNKTGSNNTLIGYQAGSGSLNNNITGNVCLGYMAGATETLSNRLYIENSSSLTYPLIFGEFDNNRVVINGNSAANTGNYNFYVNGTSGGDYVWTSTSDIRLKRDIQTLESALDKVNRLRGVNFYWKEPTAGEEGRQIGFIAQEVEKVVPEVVRQGDYYSVQYAPLTALLTEAVKELDKKNQEQAEQLEIIKRENRELKKIVEEIQVKLNLK